MHTTQALYAVSWSPNSEGGAHVGAAAQKKRSTASAYVGGAAWLAYGGAAGLVRATRVGRRPDQVNMPV